MTQKSIQTNLNQNDTEIFIPFGKYKNKKLIDILKTYPNYINWISRIWNKCKPSIHLIKKKLEKKQKNKNTGKYILGDFHFKTKKDMKKFIQDWISMSYDGYVCDEESKKWIWDLFTSHPDFDSISKDFDFFLVRCRYKTFCFSVVRKDRTEIIFSWNKCIHPPSYLQTIKSAFRLAIKPQITKFRKENFKGICEATGKPLLPNDCHIDHNFEVITFKQLLNDFCKKNNIQLKNIELGGNSAYPKIKNKTIQSGWIKYHQENAELRCIHKDINLKGSIIH